jgi:energy-coupling factor transporter ATP-binding protein EcfA2
VAIEAFAAVWDAQALGTPKALLLDEPLAVLDQEEARRWPIALQR